MRFLKSPAKINLTLDILGYNEKCGKHFMNTIVYKDDTFFDEIRIRKRLRGVKNILKCNYPEVPENTNNTVMRALDLLGIRGQEISIYKKIPIQSGLGGGSGNAAAVLKHYGKMKGIPPFQLQELASRIGADVPLFLTEGNVVYCEGFGDKVVQSWQIPPLRIEYIESGMSVSSSDAFRKIDLGHCARNSVKTETLIQLLNKYRHQMVASEFYPYIHNDFELSFFADNPEWEGKGHLCGSGGVLWKFLE